MDLFGTFDKGFIAGYRDEIRSDIETRYPTKRWNAGYIAGRKAALEDFEVRQLFHPTRPLTFQERLERYQERLESYRP
jgi:hypothetical protein